LNRQQTLQARVGSFQLGLIDFSLVQAFVTEGGKVRKDHWQTIRACEALIKDKHVSYLRFATHRREQPVTLRWQLREELGARVWSDFHVERCEAASVRRAVDEQAKCVWWEPLIKSTDPSDRR